MIGPKVLSVDWARLRWVPSEQASGKDKELRQCLLGEMPLDRIRHRRQRICPAPHLRVAAD